jgi:dolichol-phosphate mannosyltransferase
MAEKIVICLPTYNERETLPLILPRIFAAVPEAQVLVIDDNSPDGTGMLAEELAAQDQRVSVLHRETKEGLGLAYRDGFRFALEKFSPEFIVQMDADLSHLPETLPEMLAMIEDADLVLGSRYVNGGGVKNWGMHRRLLSRFGSLYARIWLGLPYHDLTGGFKLWRSDLLQKVLANPVFAGGYAFQVEMTFHAHRLGGRIREVPIMFADREDGHSKMSLAIALEALWKVPMLRWKT